MSFTIADHAKAMRELVDYYEAELKKKDAKIADLEAQLVVARNAPLTITSSIQTIDTTPKITWGTSTTGDCVNVYCSDKCTAIGSNVPINESIYVGKHDNSVSRKG